MCYVNEKDYEFYMDVLNVMGGDNSGVLFVVYLWVVMLSCVVMGIKMWVVWFDVIIDCIEVWFEMDVDVCG